MSTVVAESENVELEDTLQHIFMECDASMSMSTTYSTVSISDEVAISKIFAYIQEQLPTWSIECLVELWKCLNAVSTNDRVNLRQFKEATKRWINVQQVQVQDGNNNVQEKFCNTMNNMTMDSTKTDMDRDIAEIELRVRVRKCEEENIILREELVRVEELVANLQRKRNKLESQLDRYVEKCQQLEKENDEQKDKLNELIQKEKTYSSELQRFTKEHKNLLKRLEAAEIEIQVIPSLKNEMKKINKEKMEYMKQIAELKEKLYEKEEESEKLKAVIAEQEDISSNMKETYEYRIRNLREKNRHLMDENMELQSWSVLGCISGERISLSPVPDTDGCCTHSTPYKPEKVLLQDSLYAELKASGFTEHSKSDLWRKEFEEELDQYNVAISTILKQLEKVVRSFATLQGSTEVPKFNPLNAKDARAYNIEALKNKVAFLQNMVTEEVARKKNIMDSSTQLRADLDAIESAGQFGITNFRSLTQAYQCPKVETDLGLIVSQHTNDNTGDPFLKIIQANASLHKRNIIIPIVEELGRIIQSTIIPPITYGNSFTSGNSRYRSKHTLPSNSQLLQQFPLSAEDTRQTDSCHSSRTKSLARGDGLTQENYSEKSAKLEIELRNNSGQENLLQLEEDQSGEMSKISSVLRMDSKALSTLEETSVNSFQMPEMSDASTATSPRRKISVYYRSFDVVTIQDNSREDDQGLTLEVRQSLNNISAQKEERHQDKAVNNRTYVFRSPFSHSYRTTKSDSDSSNSCSPQKQFQESLLDDEPLIVPIVPRKVCLAPTRLKFPQEVKSGLNKTIEFFKEENCASPSMNYFEWDINSNSDSFLSSDVNNKHKKNDNAFIHSSSTFIIDKCETTDNGTQELDSYSMNNKTFLQGRSTTACLIPHNQPDPVKIADPEGPHSRTSVWRVGNGQPCVEQPVDSQMSSREDISAGSDSECEPVKPIDQCNDKKVATGANEVGITACSTVSLVSSASLTKVLHKNGKDRDLFNAKQLRRQRLLHARKSFSEGENNERTECRCRQRNWLHSTPLIQTENQVRAFPSFTNAHLQESGIANLSDTEISGRETLTEFELQKRYTAFSLCLCTDRLTLSRRMEMSLRQRDQSEKNLSYEVQKMQQNIQELAPLCTDRESVERVERVRQQLDIIAKCAHRVSCTAETLGAVHQEGRISKAVLLADRYLQLLQSRCEKLAVNVAETKRILIENNLVIEENSGELGDELPRIRYRNSTPANNRMMMARRRASVATMSRPMGSTQDMIKETVKQRNSVSGRVTLRRPSLSYESSKYETDKLNRTDSASSISELRGIFEHVESRRGSREENNNMLRPNRSSSQSIMNCAIVDDEIWMNMKQEAYPELSSVNEEASPDYTCTRSSQSFYLRNTVVPWRTVLWGVLIFFLGFYVNSVISMANICSSDSLSHQWSIEEIIKKFIQTKNTRPHPM